MQLSEPSIVDLFSGCGGFGLGAELAGFHTSVAIDIDRDLQSSYRLNFPSAKAVTADISALDAQAWKFLLNDVRPDGIIGGPPCQGFSRIGRRDSHDPRNTLIGHFFKQVAMLRPRFFVMENVEGLLDECNRDGFLAALSTIPANYTVIGPCLVNAAEFGAPTTRRRVVIVGFDPSEMGALSVEDLHGPADTSPVYVRDAIADLPSPVGVRGGELDYGWARYPTVNPDALQVSAYARAMRRAPTKGIGWHHALDRLAHGELSGFTATAHSDIVRFRFGETAAGKTETISRYPKLAWDGHCPTLRAGTGKERGSFQAVRPIHPSEGRVITVREAARLQGFPDWFVFSPTKWHSFRMIGNSVSPILARELMTRIKQRLIVAPVARRNLG